MVMNYCSEFESCNAGTKKATRDDDDQELNIFPVQGAVVVGSSPAKVGQKIVNDQNQEICMKGEQRAGRGQCQTEHWKWEDAGQSTGWETLLDRALEETMLGGAWEGDNAGLSTGKGEKQQGIKSHADQRIRGRMCSTVAATGCKRRPGQVVAYGLPLFSTWFPCGVWDRIDPP
ncbi:hypothetical protein PoB_000755300 [Plakobranchus ocellatus]|uniref:Uncharacterized protein n=1 Tax=Plakobranchus ocellatus TaxID=259542 RepID=A0AAV3YEY4_9GAST|nr:hypothetical protein PoB_000755300 [Plakobranchus ocellatus]